MKARLVVCEDMRADRQTDRHSHHNTALSWRMKELT